jgi:Sec-independent protein translocase protein TatA
VGISFIHLVLTAVIVGLIFGPKPFKKLGAGTGGFLKSFKRGWDGKEDIEITARQITDAEVEVHAPVNESRGKDLSH